MIESLQHIFYHVGMYKRMTLNIYMFYWWYKGKHRNTHICVQPHGQVFDIINLICGIIKCIFWTTYTYNATKTDFMFKNTIQYGEKQ